MRVLFFFLDGVGLGPADPETNPFITATMPNLMSLLDGRRLTITEHPVEASRATLSSLDASLGVQGLPQSATGQAALLTGLNVPALVGGHYGPKPTPPIIEILSNGNLFSKTLQLGKQAAMLNAFPPHYFDGLTSGRRLPGAMAMAARHAGLSLKTERDLYSGRGLSADFTGMAWRTMLGFPDVPVLTPQVAGARLASLAMEADLALFEIWITDMIGHRQDHQAAREFLETFDQVLGGLLDAWDDRQGLILLTSDHGNLEDLTTRRHTNNPVPCLLVGDLALRHAFLQNLHDLTGITPAILATLVDFLTYSAV
jgi:2,3-bisphosphoglycerate-independent phosphoglycerate mutase